MGKKKIQKKAEELGLNKLPLTVLYARPKRIGNSGTIIEHLSGLVPGLLIPSKRIADTSVIMFNYFHSDVKDPSFDYDKDEGARTKKYFYLAPESNLYVEVIDNVQGFLIDLASNHVIQINIYSDNEEYKKAIANVINDTYKDGILAHIKWKKIEKKYKVKQEDCIATWNRLLQN
ncbi:MAG: hypothetical protein HWN66_01050 [Candidatus Helarchaeota archaeon]|nr:hypothetical protein [Candidatus Helarchaeota archaeon]